MSEQSRVTSRCDVAHSGRENLHQFLPIRLWRHALSSSIMTLWVWIILGRSITCVGVQVFLDTLLGRSESGGERCIWLGGKRSEFGVIWVGCLESRRSELSNYLSLEMVWIRRCLNRGGWIIMGFWVGGPESGGEENYKKLVFFHCSNVNLQWYATICLQWISG